MAAMSGGATASSALPAGWEAVSDPQAGTYYYCAATGEVQPFVPEPVLPQPAVATGAVGAWAAPEPEKAEGGRAAKRPPVKARSNSIERTAPAFPSEEVLSGWDEQSLLAYCEFRQGFLGSAVAELARQVDVRVCTCIAHA